MLLEKKNSPKKSLFAVAEPTTDLSTDKIQLEKSLRPFRGASVAQRYLGPAWVCEDGIARLIIIAHDKPIVRDIRKTGRFSMIAWRWNNSPSTPVSLTIMSSKVSLERPHTRWMRASEDPVVVAMRREKRFYVQVVHSPTLTSGWFEAIFPPEGSDFESQWAFPTPGIPYSKVGVRYDSGRTESYDKEGANEIPLWPEPVSDIWAELRHRGPWEDDLTPTDRTRVVWGKRTLRTRQVLAGHIQTIAERQAFDGAPPCFDSENTCLSAPQVQEESALLFTRSPLLARWMEAICGSTPDAKAAYDAAFEVLHDGYAVFCLLDKLFTILVRNDDNEIYYTLQASIDAALLDHRITRSGERRPWFSNTYNYAMKLETMDIDLNTHVDNIDALWVTGMEWLDLIDTGLRLGPQDFPIPYEHLTAIMEHILVEGSIEEVERATQALLEEAKEARQWSIPWGALVEVHIEPFHSVVIYEENGEFSCYFLDSENRYLHVAVGIRDASPSMAMSRLVRTRSDDGEMVWNEDAEASLKLIAASIIRDFLVCEERETLFTVKPIPKRQRARGRNKKTIIYLPRVRYTTHFSAGADSEYGRMTAERAKHEVKGHLRKVKKSSPAQQQLAKRYGVRVPQGFTFVRPHARGGERDAVEKERVYRSRSASMAIFNQIDKAPAGSRPEWFEFEKDCARLLKSRGMTVIHQSANRNGDDGVDLYAIDSDGQSWVVQCKCWAITRAIGPGVVRELEGAINLADRGKDEKSRGMIITTSKLTQKAVDAAKAFGFEWIEGEQLGEIAVSIS